MKRRIKIVFKYICMALVFELLYYSVFHEMAIAYIGHPIETVGWNIFAIWLYKYITPVILGVLPLGMCIWDLVKIKKVGGE